MKSIAFSSFILGTLLVFFYFSLFIFPKTFVLNDYYDLPETTILEFKNNDLSYVDNTDFINKHRIFKQTKYDPIKDNGRNPLDIIQLSIPEKFNTVKSDLFSYTPLSAYISNLFIPHFLPYFDKDNKVLAIGGGVNTEHEFKWRNFIFPCKIYTQDEEAPSIINQFLNKNTEEFYWQFASRYFFHHHNFFLGSINELFLGRAYNEINSQYGFLNLYFIGYLCKLFGDINFQTYISALNVFSIIYFLFFLIFIQLICKNIKYTAAAALGYAAITFCIPFKFSLIAPGLNPLRHFLDIPVLMILYLMIKTESKKYFLIFLSIEIILIFSIAFSGIMGLFLFLGINASLFFHFIWQNRSNIINYFLKYFSLQLIFALLALVIFHLISTRDALSKYYLKGLLTFHFSFTSIILTVFTFASIILGFLLIGLFWKELPNLKVILLALAFYCLQMLLYVIWGSTPEHFLCILPLFLAMWLLWIKSISLLKNNFSYVFEKLLLPVSCASFFLILIYGGILIFYPSYRSIQNIKDSHLTYEWKNPNAKIISTISEYLFNCAITLINKYIPEKEKGIYIYSKYDNIIPFLAGKYSAMAYPDLQWFVMNENMAENVTNKIKKEKPEFIFVDKDIDRNLEYEYQGSLEFITNTIQNRDYKGAFRKESFFRVYRIGYLKILFDKVKHDYILIDSSPLISVWKRRW
ncbi:MAG TPA: hypothetical protein DD381_08755 [Lentisphaeria bacterium]|nr:MAG: hypothetical protein A2X47_08095 [Lentisphaerae bacterium GWF2_38_69]HBM16413.1 hypothetical protein [Lentisphaeria bacterium]